MKKPLVILLTAILLCSCMTADKSALTQNSPKPAELNAVTENISQTTENAFTPLNYDKQKAVWITYMDMTELLTENENEFSENISRAFECISGIGANTVYVHVRAFGDAYYSSKLYAAAENVPTENGVISYDPLEIMTKLAHEYKLSFHAWINPMRCCTEENMQNMKGTKIYEWYSDTDKYDEYISKPADSDFYWLNPACEEVRELIADGAAEIAENYEVDGIHIDDYFYPTTDESFDKMAYSAASTDISLAQWRLENCSLMVNEIYSAVKSINKDILFGVSPQGNIDNNYSQMYADVKLWCSEEGYLDYIAPQIYFGYENSICPFAETLAEWQEIAYKGEAELVVGLGVYKLDTDEEFINDEGIIAAQISDVFDSDKSNGVALYSYDSLFNTNEERFLTELELISNVLS